MSGPVAGCHRRVGCAFGLIVVNPAHLRSARLKRHRRHLLALGAPQAALVCIQIGTGRHHLGAILGAIAHHHVVLRIEAHDLKRRAVDLKLRARRQRDRRHALVRRASLATALIAERGGHKFVLHLLRLYHLRGSLAILSGSAHGRVECIGRVVVVAQLVQLLDHLIHRLSTPLHQQARSALAKRRAKAIVLAAALVAHARRTADAAQLLNRIEHIRHPIRPRPQLKLAHGRRRSHITGLTSLLEVRRRNSR